MKNKSTFSTVIKRVKLKTFCASAAVEILLLGNAQLFAAALARKGLLLRCYTQNVDGLELLAGVPLLISYDGAILYLCTVHPRTVGSCARHSRPSQNVDGL